MQNHFLKSCYLVRGVGDCAGEDERVESAGRGDVLEDFADVLIRQRILSASLASLVLQLSLLDKTRLLLELLQHQVLMLVELDALLVELVHGVHHGPDLGLQGGGGPEVEILSTARGQRQLLLHVQQECVDQVGVLDHDGDLSQHRLEADVQVLDRVRGEVILLEHLDGVLRHPIRLQRQKSLGSLRRV